MRTNSTHGFSLISVLVSVSILSVLALGLSSLFTSLYRNQSQLALKADAIGLQMLLDRMISSDKYCSCLFRSSRINTGSNAFNLGAMTNLPNGFDSSCNPQGGALVTKGAPFVPNAQITVADLKVTDLMKVSDGLYSAKLRVEFGNTSGAVIPQVESRIGLLKVDPNPPYSWKSILSCGFADPSTPTSPIIRIDHPWNGGSIFVPANRCKYAIRLDMYMNAQRGDQSGQHYMSFTTNVSGSSYWKSVEVLFGSNKSGGSGHGWHYRNKGSSRTTYIDAVDRNLTFSFSANNSDNLDDFEALASLTCI